MITVYFCGVDALFSDRSGVIPPINAVVESGTGIYQVFRVQQGESYALQMA